jgi:beta-N-acetylhexosaminidase
MNRERVTAVGGQTSLADRKRRAGQRLLIGFDGPSVTEDLRRLVAEIRPVGFVLYGRNVEEPLQVLELNRELASLVDAANPALLAVDQEGGREQRIGDPATPWPPMRAVGRAAESTAGLARAIARELRAMGFNLNFAPVADVDTHPNNPVIGDRSFGSDPREVAHHVATFVAGHQAEWVIACAKHFPGHGDTELDSHLALPRVEREEPDLREVELVPFRAAVEAGVGSMMTAHVVYSAWDEERPATLSQRIVPPLLRKELGFDGVVFSDDLEMEAIRGRWSPAEQVRGAVRATVDVLLSCAQAESQLELFRELVYIQERDETDETAFRDAVARVDALRLRFLKGCPPPPGLEVVGTPEHLDLSAQITARGARGC